MATDPQSHIANHLLAAKSLPVSPDWLSQFLSSQRVNTTPLSALTQTALFRLLTSDFTISLSVDTTSSSSQSPCRSLPVDICDPAVQERRIPGPVPVQILDIDDIGSSLWTQVETMEMIARGEQMKGREIIRTVTLDEGEELGDIGRPGSDVRTAAERATSCASSLGPHRLVLQDAKGTKVIAIELAPVDGIGIGKTSIGAKMILKNATVARGILLLESACTTLMGGKIEVLDRQWKEQRKDKLLAQLAQMGANETA